MAPEKKYPLPVGVLAVKRKGGKVDFYWAPGRGTDAAGPMVRLPDDPKSLEFWQALEDAKKGSAKPVKMNTVAAMIEAFLNSPQYAALAASTRREYARYMNVITKAIGHFDASDVEPKHVAKIRDKLGKQPATANAIMRAIGSVYAWGIELGYARTNPATGLKKLKIGEYQPWPQWAWKLAMEHLRADIRTACIFALYTGQRLGDVLKMKLSDISENTIEVRQQKTGAVLNIKLHSELIPLVTAAKRRGHFYLVSKPNGQPFTRDQFHAAWGREMAKQELKPIREAELVFHGLRKSAAVKLAEAGCTEHEIASITGQSLAMVQHYTKQANQLGLATAAIEKLEGARK